MDEQFRLRRKLDSDLRTALAEEQFELYFQPVVSVMDRQPTSFEALLRWRHPERGILSPDEFIPLAEENGLIVPLGEWALRTACREAAGWPAHIRVAVNVSALQFRAPTFLRSVSEAIRAANMTGSRLIVEVTESVMVKDAEQVVSTLHIMREMGIAIAMDDFGTGYSSLNYLRRFPFDKIKIDKSFIAELGQREDSTAIVRAATSLARALGMKTVAEGIETEDQLSRVRIEGCSEAQGYLIRSADAGARGPGFPGRRARPGGQNAPIASGNRGDRDLAVAGKGHASRRVAKRRRDDPACAFNVGWNASRAMTASIPPSLLRRLRHCGQRRRAGLELKARQAGVKAVGGEERGVSSLFDD